MKNRKQGIPLGIVFLFSVILFVACDNTRVYEEWKDIEGGVWNEDSVCHFTFDIEDSLALYNFNVGVRNTNLYPFLNLWLLTSIEGGVDSFLYQDTIPLKLADKNGEWYGKRSARIYTYVTTLYHQLRFVSPGEYTFSIKHGMRKEDLAGVSSIGFRIETTD